MAGPRRSDARHNRARVLDAAREALTRDGDASLNSIAKLAGVGPGTLYRHFPNRESLVLAVYRTEVQRLVDWAPELLEADPPGVGHALVDVPERHALVQVRRVDLVTGFP